MSWLDRLFGRQSPPEPPRPPMPASAQPASADEQALARYRYMLETAPPETIEQAHAEAFAKLTPEQRRLALQQLTATLPDHERRAQSNLQDDPQTLARLATRAEMRQPGTLERTFSQAPGMGMGGMLAGGLFSSLAGAFIGTMIAQQLFSGLGGYDNFNPDYNNDPNNDFNSGFDQDMAAQDDPGMSDADFGDFGSDLAEF